MPTDAEIDAALEAVITAARHHRATLRAPTATEEAVSAAYVALNNATVRYDDLLSEEYDEVTPWDCEYLAADEATDGATDGVPAGGPTPVAPASLAPGQSVTVCVRQRRDYFVPDVGPLLDAAARTRAAVWAEHDPEHAATPIANVGEAVYELVQAGDGTIAALDAYPDELVPGNGVFAVNAVARPLELTESPDAEPDAPFRLAPSDPLLYRLDEIVEDDDETLAEDTDVPTAGDRAAPGAHHPG